MNILKNLDDETINNDHFRDILYTGKMQLALMSLPPGKNIGYEIHDNIDQFIQIKKGIATVSLDDIKHKLRAGDAVIIPSGISHDITNRSDKTYLKIYTIYSEPQHHINKINKHKYINTK